MRLISLLLALSIPAAAQTADEIMARVADNQNRAEQARTGFVYRQQILVRLQRSDGKLAREEDREYTVTPQADGADRNMVHFAGKFGVKGKVFPFTDPGYHYKDTDIDADLAGSLADEFGGDSKTRDGINSDLFPLTANKQKYYRFRLAGQENYRGHDVFRIAFEPSGRQEQGGTPWAGEALIDKADFAPVLITSHLARGIPLIVKTVLGTNLQQLGFKVSYEKVDGNLWFPVSYSGELKVKVLFLYSRTIAMSMVNSDFKQADVKSSIRFEDQTN